MQIKDRIKELRRVAARDLLPNPRNWRTHPDAQADALKGVLAEIGFANAVLARETPHGLMLLDGHLRAEVAATEIIPVLVLDVNEVEADKLLVTLDLRRQSKTSTIDRQKGRCLVLVFGAESGESRR